MCKRLVLAVAALCVALAAESKVRLSHLVGDNMVLQQKSEARLWGWDDPGKEIKVTVSWAKTVYKTTADKDGKWLVSVATPAASYTPLSITFDDGEKTTISNILSGEVWVCAGQSNMEMPMAGYDNCPTEGYNAEMVNARQYQGIHFCTLPMSRSAKPKDDANCKWRVVAPNTIGMLSAVGYFFAQNVNRALDIPVGLIVAVKGGSRVEAWLDYDNLRAHTDEPLDEPGMKQRYGYNWKWPLVWGNATFHPILNYTVKGILYYQGCSNVEMNTEHYAERLKLLVEQWRRDFGLGEIPFYITQITPYVYANNPDSDLRGRLVEQQMKAAKTIPNAGIVCTQDLVYPWEDKQIHPAQKRQVGDRLAYQALNKQYGLTSIQCESPAYERLTISNDTCYIQLRNMYKGFSLLPNCELKGFEVAGEDRVFHPATAHAKGKNIVWMTCPEVKKPVAVRYCFRNWQTGNVYNTAMLPLSPFRTDDW
ncbi:MAG: sialate O-acetylesterase [Prevotella sp.]